MDWMRDFVRWAALTIFDQELDRRIEIEGVDAGIAGNGRSIWTIARGNDDVELIHLINLLHSDNPGWYEQQTEAQQPLKDLTIHVRTKRPIRQLWQDSYYGGGQWVLLTAWLGWYYAQAGKPDQAQALLEWVEAQVDESGFLPEQTAEELIAPEQYQPWVDIRGPIANPLLWSHAMYLVLVTNILP